MFGDPVLNPYKFPDMPLSMIASIKIGPFGSLLHADDYIKNGHCLVNPAHIIDGEIVVDKTLSVSDKKFQLLDSYHLYPGDIVLGRRGEMGRCAVVTTKGLLCGTGSMIISPRKEIRSEILKFIISFPSFKKILEDSSVGQTMPNLNVKIVSNLNIPIPELQRQDQFIEFSQFVYKSKYRLVLSEKWLKTLFKNESKVF